MRVAGDGWDLELRDKVKFLSVFIPFLTIKYGFKVGITNGPIMDHRFVVMLWNYYPIWINSAFFESQKTTDLHLGMLSPCSKICVPFLPCDLGSSFFFEV